MSDELIRFEIPAQFINARVRLTPGELAYGYGQGWIKDQDVVSLALAHYSQGGSDSDALDGLALLLNDELDRVRELIDEIARGIDPAELGALRAVWIYLAMAWIYEHRSNFVDPLGLVELLYADFGYPSEIEGVVRFMPGHSGASGGARGLERRWKEFLDRESVVYRCRGAEPV